MKSKVIFWIDNIKEHRFINDLRIKTLCLNNNICPVLGTKDSIALWEALEKPETFHEGRERVKIQGTIDYIDEIYSGEETEEERKKYNWIQYADDNTVYGESGLELIDKLVKNGAKQITFTSYGWHLFRIFGLNIRMPFTNQIRTWEKLEKKYGFKIEVNSFNKQPMFNYCWISLKKNRGDYKELIDWCKNRGKQICLIKDSESVEEVLEMLQEFVKYL